MYISAGEMQNLKFLMSGVWGGQKEHMLYPKSK